MQKIYTVIFSALIFVCCGSVSCAADFDITAVPLKYQNAINFGTIGKNYLPEDQEVNLTVTNTAGVRYRLMQVSGGPLRSSNGAQIPYNKFLIYTKEGRNGSLGAQIPTPVNPASMVLYTSDNSGTADTIKAVYSLQLDTLPQAGIYDTFITYILEPIDSATVSAKSVTINVTVDIAAKITIKAYSIDRGARINFGAINENILNPISQEVILDIESNLGRQYRIMQSMPDSFKNNTGESIEENNFLFVGQSCESGQLTQSTPTAVSITPILIYRSDNSGSSGKVSMLYTLSVPLSQKAGLYTGMLNFAIQTDMAGVGEDARIETEVEVEPMFNLEVSGANLNFGKFSSEVRVQSRQVHIKAITNLAQRYQVSQTTMRRLTDIKGRTLPEDSFTMQTQGGKLGTAKIDTPCNVPEGSISLYVSNIAGDADTFDVNYQLKLPEDIAGGDYSTEIIYTLSTL